VCEDEREERKERVLKCPGGWMRGAAVCSLRPLQALPSLPPPLICLPDGLPRSGLPAGGCGWREAPVEGVLSMAVVAALEGALPGVSSSGVRTPQRRSLRL
jgi:hypothetical protein